MQKLKTVLPKWLIPFSAGIIGFGSMSSHAAICEYSIDNEWPNGFVATIRITNDTSTTINNWNVNWSYSGSDRVASGWNATVSGSNPYSAVGVSWNSSIQPGQFAEFGVQGSKSVGAAAEVVTVGGNVCSSSGPTPTPVPTITPVPTTTPVPTVTPTPTPPSSGVFRVDNNGKVTKDGNVVPLQCGSWFGLEGRHEPSDDPTNPSGAPMELYIGNTFWANGNQGTGRTMQQTFDEITSMGINVIRFPIVPQTLDPNDPQGKDPFLKNHQSVRGVNARQSMEEFIKLADANDVEIILDIHSCSNYLGWRAGRLDAVPPYADANREDYDFPREDYACAPAGPGVTVHEYNEQMWLDDLRELAGLSAALGVDNILGIDIFNEPHDYTWQQWKTMAEKAYKAIDEVNPNLLVVVEGTSASTKAEGPQPHGDLASNPNWGENFFEQGTNPLDIPKERLVLSPHTYGPSVFVQSQFLDPAQPQCAGLEGDAAGDADCNIVIDPPKLVAGWEEHFGYLRDQGFAILVGEFGGHFNWPEGSSTRDINRWGHITTNVDEQWQNAFVDYMIDQNIEGCYWSINPESGDTGGLFEHAYDPISNTAGWGEWVGFDTKKWNLLNRLWSNN
ncbi:cellulase family glycosylhydrolase [Agarilytica rhodophyticola]|uniref:cellulase family glycosylhydrolase n=1 Tax=Agarilytica rhodophyticola TaxID=1737490 RepID=UPI000B3478BE|nr:cellulase family glycosylhydrolase [Agarilytica rhodophyticola]